MTSEDLRSELERDPFTPLRLHLVSGKTIEVRWHGQAWMLQNAVMILPGPKQDETSLDYGYNIVALRNIERLERLPRKRKGSA
jgi:hypothetical protein